MVRKKQRKSSRLPLDWMKDLHQDDMGPEDCLVAVLCGSAAGSPVCQKELEGRLSKHPRMEVLGLRVAQLLERGEYPTSSLEGWWPFVVELVKDLEEHMETWSRYPHPPGAKVKAFIGDGFTFTVSGEEEK